MSVRERQTCATCRAFNPTNPNDLSGVGECCLRAPAQSYFPLVYGHKWCLEHVPLSDELDPDGVGHLG